MEDALIVVTTEGDAGLDGRFSLWAGAGEAERYIRSLVERGTPAAAIQVFRARPLALRRETPVAA